MLPNRVDSTATLVKHQYGLFIGSATGAFGRVLDSSDPTTKGALKRLSKNLGMLVKSASLSMHIAIESGIRSVVYSAIEDSGVPVSEKHREDILSYAKQVTKDLYGQIFHCLNRDSQMVTGALHKLSLVVELRSSNGSTGKVTAIIGARFGAIDKLKFHQRDRLGRKYVSDAFIYSCVRKTVLDAYLWARLYAQAKAGNDIARVVNPGKENDGLVFSVSGTKPEYPSFLDIQDEVFHPRTNASVEAVTL